MTLGQALYAELSGFALLAAQVGTRIYPNVAPLGVTRPYVAWVQLSGLPVKDMAGSGGLTVFEVAISAYAGDATQVAAITSYIAAAMAAATNFRATGGDLSTGFDAVTRLYSGSLRFRVTMTPS